MCSGNRRIEEIQIPPQPSHVNYCEMKKTSIAISFSGPPALTVNLGLARQLLNSRSGTEYEHSATCLRPVYQEPGCLVS
jgi:hypothetical protein